MYAPFTAEAMVNFLKSLVIMFKGMTGIFIFMLVFYMLIRLMSRYFKPEEKEN